MAAHLFLSSAVLPFFISKETDWSSLPMHQNTEIHCSETVSRNSSIQLELLKSQESIHSAEETEPNVPAIAAMKPLLFYYCYKFFT